MDRLRMDVSQAARALRANPGYALAGVLTLAIGIGANAAVFNLAHWLLMRPVPGVEEPERLVSMSLMPQDRSGASFISNPQIEALRAGVTSVTGIAAYHDLQLHVAAPGAAARRLPASVVSDNYFDVLGRPVALGRGFTRDEGVNAGAPPTAVISHDFWVSSFGAVPDVLGRTLTVNGGVFTIVGVTTPGFRGTSRAGDISVWVPVAQHKFVMPMFLGNLLTNDRASVFFSVIARRRDDVPTAQVESESNVVRAAAATGTRRSTWTLVAREGMEPAPWMRDRVNRLLMALVGGAVLLLALTCANVSSLTLARATGRRTEIATRLALGASRFSVARLLLVECLALSLLAGALALGVTWALGRALEGTDILPGVVTLGRIGIGWTMLAFAFGTSLLVAAIAGVAPAFSVARVAPQVRMREGGRGLAGSRSRIRQVLTVAQVAVSVTLLLGAMLLVRSVNARFSIPIGFDPATVVTASIEPALQRYTPERTEQFYRDLLDRVRALPGVRAAGLSWLAPFSRGAADTEIRTEGAPSEAAVSANHNMVSPGFLNAMGIPLLEGRDFTPVEFLRPGTATDGSIIITASMARRVFAGGPAAGRRVVIAYPEGTVRTVVGVIPDQRQHRLMDETADLVLEPFGQPFASGAASVQVALEAPSDEVMRGLVDIVQALDPALPVFQAQTLETALRKSMGEELLVSRSVTVLAALAMLVAGVGLAAVLARAVTERQREFGVRLACGATPGRLAAQVTREALLMSAIGIAGGLALALWFVRFISARLYGVASNDPVSILVVAAGVLVVTILAAAMPARRAAQVDPATALR